MTVSWLWILILCFDVLQALVMDHRGRSFMIAFLDNYSDENTNLIVITAESDAIVYVNIPALHRSQQYFINGRTSKQIPLFYNTTLSSNFVVEQKAIFIVASSKVSVYGFSMEYKSLDGFLALPVEALSTSYLTTSYFPYRKKGGQIGVVATEDNTSVQIQISLRELANCDTSLMVHGQTLNFTLNRYDAVRVFCDQDLSGSLVTADKPVGVFSGNPCSEVPAKTNFCDHLVEMMPPLYALGRKYMIHSIMGRKSGILYRLLASEDGTEITISGGKTYKLDRMGYEDIEQPEGKYDCLESTKPFMVVMYTKGQTSDPVEFVGDPFMVVVPAVNRFATTYLLDTAIDSSNRELNPFVTVMVHDTSRADFDFIASSSLINVPACKIKVGMTNVTRGVVKLSQSYGDPFGAVTYGLIENESYGFPAGILLQDFSGAEECKTVSCQNNGICYELGTTYGCHCPLEFTGRHCETDAIDLCKDNPCFHNATCVDGNGNFMCNCLEKYTGSLCETEITTPSPTTQTTDKHTPSTSKSTHSAPSASSVTPATVPPGRNICFCTCPNVTLEEVKVKAEEIKKELTVNPLMLSKTQRKYVSVQDNRTSAASIGYLGAAFLALVFGSIFLLDFSSVLKRCIVLIRKSKNLKSDSSSCDLVASGQVLLSTPSEDVLSK